MGKQRKWRMKKILCGILCSAMVATSVIVPDMSAYAAQTDEIQTVEPGDDGSQDINNGGSDSNAGTGGGSDSNAGADGGSDSNAGTGGGSDSNGGTGDGSGSNGGTGDGSDSNGGTGDGSGSNAGIGDGSGTNGGTGNGSGSNGNTGDGSGSEDDGNTDDGADDKGEADKDAVTDKDDEKDSVDEELDEKKTESKPMSVLSARAVTASSGSLQNGDFETASADSEYMPAAWSAAWGDNVTYYEYKTSGGNSGGYVESKWNEDDSVTTTFSLSQVIESFSGGNYTLSVDISGVYDADTVYVKVEKVTQNGDEYTASGDPLLEESLGSSSAWTWSAFTSAKFTVPEDAGTIRVSFEGTLGSSKQIKLDNVKLETAPDVTEKMFYFYCEPEEGETAPLSLGAALWSNDGGSITTSVTEKVGDHFVMSPVEGYADWYQIPLAVTDEVTDAGSKAGINIFKEPSGGGTDYIAQIDGWNNTDIYKLLLADDTKACAMKNWKGYVDNGTDKARHPPNIREG